MFANVLIYIYIYKDNVETLLLIKESLFIHRDKPDLNIQGASTPLTLFVN